MKRKKVDVYGRIKRNYLVPIFTTSDFGIADSVITALVEGGSGVIELTHRAENSYSVFQKVCEKFSGTGILIGAGSIIDEPTAAMYINTGADFIVAPNFNRGIARLCNRLNILYVPGCATVNEILTAYEQGVIAVKLFPAGEMGGPGFLKNIKGPCSWVDAIATGGVEPSEDNLRGWIDAGAVAVGMGSKLIRKDFIKEGDWDSIKELTAETLQIIQNIRG